MKELPKRRHKPLSVRRPLRLLKHARQRQQAQQETRQQHCSSMTGRQAQGLTRFLPKATPDGTSLLVHEGGVHYRVDRAALGEALPKNCRGLAYRCTKDFRDKDPRLAVPWGRRVEGADEGNGWVKVQLSGREPDLVEKEIVQTNDWVLRHLTEMGLRQGLVKQVKKALAPKTVASNALSLKPFPFSMVEKVFGYTSSGKFSVDVYSLSGCIGSVTATATMTTQELGEKVSKLSGIPVLHQRLVGGTSVLQFGELIAKFGVSPMQNQITVLRMEEYPQNPIFPLKTLVGLLPGRRMPHTVRNWQEVQAAVWPGYPPLKDGWIRVVSNSSLKTYFHNVHSGERTYDYAKARMDVP